VAAHVTIQLPGWFHGPGMALPAVSSLFACPLQNSARLPVLCNTQVDAIHASLLFGARHCLMKADIKWAQISCVVGK
jgi:hypothetical protein